jgi:Fe(3+) dicitrate transport protein
MQKMHIGLRVHRDELDRFQWVDQYDIESGTMKLSTAGKPGTDSNLIELAKALSTYVQYKLSWNKLILTPGLRYEHIRLSRKDYGKADTERVGTSLSERENTVSVVIPGMAASYQLSTYANLFGGIHKGFAPPGSTVGANPEESWNYEIGYRYNKEGVRLQALGYYNNYSNLLGSDLAATGGTGSQDLFNGGEANAIGIEMEAGYDLLGTTSSAFSLPLSMSYTYTHTTFGSSFESGFEAWGNVASGDFLPYVPMHQLSMSLSAEHAKVMLDLSARYSTEMLTNAGSFDNINIGKTDAAFTMDFAINHKLSKEISAFVNVNNLTDNVYIVSRRPAGVRPNQPRTFILGLKANF